jgi:uncharacterized protein
VTHATGVFRPQLTPRGEGQTASDLTLDRMGLTKVFTGDLEGTGEGQMLTGAAPQTGMSRWMGPIAGIAAGLGIAALLFSGLWAVALFGGLFGIIMGINSRANRGNYYSRGPWGGGGFGGGGFGGGGFGGGGGGGFGGGGASGGW